jgi:hypothetical protein
MVFPTWGKFNWPYRGIGKGVKANGATARLDARGCPPGGARARCRRSTTTGNRGRLAAAQRAMRETRSGPRGRRSPRSAHRARRIPEAQRGARGSTPDAANVVCGRADQERRRAAAGSYSVT